jgi:hypothetical protein
MIATCAAVAVIVGTCLSWGRFPAEGQTPEGSIYRVFEARNWVEANGWLSVTVFRGIPFPNFLPCLAAVVLAIWTWVDRGAGRSTLAGVLITYGVLHSLGASLLAFGVSGSGVLGIGPVIVFFAYLAMIVSFAKADPVPGETIPPQIS